MWKEEVVKWQTKLNMKTEYTSLSLFLDINLWNAVSHILKDTWVEMDGYTIFSSFT